MLNLEVPKKFRPAGAAGAAGGRNVFRPYFA